MNTLNKENIGTEHNKRIQNEHDEYQYLRLINKIISTGMYLND